MTDTEDTAATTYLVNLGGKEVQIEVPGDAWMELLKGNRLLVWKGDVVIASFNQVTSFYPESMEPKKREFAG